MKIKFKKMKTILIFLIKKKLAIIKKLTSTQGEIARHRGGKGCLQFGQFDDMCIKPTPTKCVALNFGFHSWCLGFVF